MKILKLSVCSVLVASGVVAPALTSSPVQAASDITFNVSSPGSVLADTPTLIPVSLNAANPVGGDGLPGFNVTFSVIVPIGVIPSGFPEPTSVSVVGINQILVYQNVGDVQEGSNFSLDISLEAPAADFPVGSVIDIDANVFVNTDPRTVPDVSADGTTATDSTSTAADGSTTTLGAVDITKISPDMNFGNEALRGVHDHVVEFQIDLFNTSQGPTDDSIVDDFIPASMEFLGCGTVDNTTDSPSNPGNAEEYPGSGLLTATAPPAGPCPTPVLVESISVAGGVITSGTSTNSTLAPVGVPDGVYTHVVWDTGTLPAAAAGTAATVPATTLSYQAGIPILENVYDPNLFWDNRTGTVVTGTSGDPTANLDNNGLQAPGDNTSLYTNEEAAEDGVANFASVVGDYTGVVAPGTSTAQADSTEFAYTIEDLAIGKNVAVPDPLLQGDRIDYTLTIRTSEYREVTDMTVVDPISDGQCPLLGAGNNPETLGSPSTDCVSNPAPSSDLLSLVENANGSWLMTWDSTAGSEPDLAFLGASDEYTITFSTLLRDSYQEDFEDDAPTNGADAFENSVDLDGTSNLIAGIPDDPTFDAATIFDDGGVSFGTSSAAIDKSVSLPEAVGVNLDCDSATYVRTDPAGMASPAAPAPLQDPVFAFRTGDRVCYRLGVDFPASLNFRNPVVNDFLPPGFAFEQFWGTNATTGQTAANTVAIDATTTTVNAAGDTVVDWNLGMQDPDTVGGAFEDDLFVSNGGTRFEVIFSAVVERGPEDIVQSDLMSNLMKFNTSNIDGDTISLRDSADVEFAQPNVGIEKSTPAMVVTEGQVVPYTVTVTNNFSDLDRQGATLGPADLERVEALAISNWDVLPVGITCSDITVAPLLDVPGTVTPCADGIGADGRSVIAFTIDSLPPQEAGSLTYSVTIPTGVSAGQSLTNDTGVRQYTGTANNDGTPGTTYVPSDNIDTSQPDGNMPPALDEATITTPMATLGKIQASQFEDLPGASTNIANSPASSNPDEATIGEQIVYTVNDVLVPQGITIYNATVTDQIPAGTSLVSLDTIVLDDGDGTVTSGTAASPPAGFTYAESGGLVTVTFPATYANANGTGDDTLDFTFTVVVDDDTPPNLAGATLVNAATFEWETAIAGGQTINATSNDVVITIVEPNPMIDKTNNAPSPAVPGAPITFTHEITNPDVGGDTSNAYDIVVTDVLPDGLVLATNPNGGTISPDGQTIVWDSGTTPTLASLEPGETITITYTATIEPPAVADETLTNVVGLSATSLPGIVVGERTYDNGSDSDVLPPNASIVKDVQPLGDLADDDLDFTLGQPIDYDITVTIPQGVVTYDATAFDQLPAGLEYDSFGTPVVSAECIIFDPATRTPTGTALVAADIALLAPPVGGDAQRLAAFFGDLAAVGGPCTITVPYTVHVAGTAVGDLTNESTFVWNSGDVIIEAPEDLTALPANYDDPAGDWNQVSDPSSETVTVVEPQLELDQDVAGAGGATLVSPTCDTTPGNHTTATDDPDGLPTDGCDVEAGAEILKTLTITNTGTSDAFDTTVVEAVPVGVTPLVAVGGAVAGDGDTITGPSGSTGTWDEGTGTITWVLPAPIEPGTPVTLDFAAQLDDSDDLADEQDFTFEADIPQYFGIPETERDQIVLDNAANDDIATYGATTGVRPADPDSATIEVHFPELTITKDETAPSDPTDAMLDQPYNWRITVTNSDTVATAFDVDVTDTLPAFATLPGAWTYVATSAIVTSPNNAGVQIEPAGGPNGPLVWTDVDDLAPGETIVIDVQVVPNSAILAPDKPTGTVNLGSDVTYTNAVTTVADDASGSDTYDGGTPISDGTTDDVVIREIDLSVTKAVTSPAPPAPVYFGGVVEYTVTVTNDGPDDATGVELTDSNLGSSADPNDTILFVGVISIPAGDTFDGATGIWTVGELAAGETATLVVSARLNTTNPPEAAINDVEVSTADQFDTDSDPGNLVPETPVEDDEALVSLDPLPSTLGNYIWLDLDGDGIQDVGEPGVPEVDVVVTFTDPGGIARQITVTTDSSGAYNVPPLFVDELTGETIGLPIDIDITATVETTAPNLAGATATNGAESDVDGNADSTSTQRIGDPGTETLPDGVTQARLDIDFGYQPAEQSLGDRLWWDLDASGDDSDGVGEYGIGDATVEIVWYGFDGALGGGDDITYTTITSDGTIDVDGDGNVDPAGTWNSRYDPGTGLAEREIPTGNYEVGVDPTTLPAGLPIVTYDLDGTGTPLLVEGLTLDSGDNLTDIDFSVTGEGLIGDTIWFDQNGDGVVDPNEPGLGGVDVMLTWAGPDGDIITVDDNQIITTTTGDGTTDVDGDGTIDPAGTYLFSNLPDGIFVVDVNETTLPPDMTQTGDPDLALDGESTVTLDSAVGATENLDQDFGYRGDLSIGDLVFYDLDGNGSGVVDGPDVPLSGVDVTIASFGPDGIEGTTDDFSVTVTTGDGTIDVNGDGSIDPPGFYQVDNLISGEYVITVDRATLPNGIDEPTYDFDELGAPDAIDTPDTSTTTLVDADDLDQDFSYTASGAVGDTVWFDQDSDGVVDPGEPGLVGIDVTVSSDGPDGLPGTFDDILVAVTTSDGTTDVDGDGTIDPPGSYSVPNLPFDVPITVTVDPTNLPPGLQPTSDDDGIATPDTSTVTLTPLDPIDTDQDFGYNGVGEIGDTIWFDRDGAGGPTVDTTGGDVGFENVLVTLTWTNPTSGPDLVVTTSTDENGEYLFTGLPEGDYTVTIDPSDLPAGLAPVYDPDGTTDLTSTVVLDDAATSDLDQDFSFTGSGSIGDTIWHDRDGDGVVDPGEEPLPGVGVTITFTDPDNGSTFTIMVVTDSDGTYDVDNLPAGGYVVTVDPATLPQGYQPTFDDDGGLDATSSIDLGPGESNDDQDFGFRAEVDLRVVKTHVGDFTIGEEGTFDFAIDNFGPSVAEAPVVVTDTLPEGLTFVRSVGADWDCVADGQIVTCAYEPGGLDVTTESETFSIVVMTEAAAAPMVTNVANISTPTVDTDPTNNDTSDEVAVPLSRLTLTKTLDGMLVATQTATYRLVVFNDGPVDTSEPIVVVDDLPAGLTFVSAGGVGWVCIASGQRVECTFSESLAVDQTSTIVLAADVTAMAGASITNSATVEGGVNATGEGDATTGTVQPAPALPGTGSDGSPIVRAGAMVLLIGVALTILAGWRRRRDELVTS